MLKRIKFPLLTVLLIVIASGCIDDGSKEIYTKMLDVSVPVVTSFVSIADSPSQINLTWTASGEDISSYVLYNYETSSYIYQGADTSFTHTGLVEGTIYSYSVMAYNGQWSDPAYVDATTSTSTATIDTFTAIVNGSSQIDLSWTASGIGISSYVLYNYETSSYIYQGADTSFIHTGLAKGTIYSYSLMAYNGQWSDPAYVQV